MKLIDRIIDKFKKRKSDNQKQSEEIINKNDDINEELSLDSEDADNYEKLQYLSEIKTKIYFGKIDNNFIEEISKNEILSEYEKTIVLLAICEKNNMLERARQIKSKANITDKQQIKEINRIVERIKSTKKTKFDLTKYDNILSWKIDEELLRQYQEEDSKKGIEQPKDKIKQSDDLKEKIESSRKDKKPNHVRTKKEEEESFRFLSEIKTKIYCNKITQDEIKQIQENDILTEYEKTIALLAICEKKKMPQLARQIQIDADIEDEKQKNEIKKIVERIKSKKNKLFDLEKYNGLIGWKIDVNLLNNFKKQDKYQQIDKQPKETINNDSTDTKQPPKRKIVKNENLEKKLKETININKSNKISNEENIGNRLKVVLDYLKEKRIELYVRTNTTDIEARKKAIEQLDKMSDLIEKVKRKKEGSKYISYMYEKIERLKQIEKRQKEREKQQQEDR